jgi:hypothetical protein
MTVHDGDVPFEIIEAQDLSLIHAGIVFALDEHRATLRSHHKVELIKKR